MEAKIKAMVRLLCVEENPGNIEVVRKNLVDLGSRSVPLLKTLLGEAGWPEPDRISSVLKEIAWQNIGNQLRWWVDRTDGENLEEAVFCVSLFGDPDLDLDHYRKMLDDMAEVMGPRLAPLRSSMEVVEALKEYLFKDVGFRGNVADYYDPDNSYLNRVLERKVGIPITLSVLVLLLSKRLDLPMVGVGLPGHFLCRYNAVGGQEIYLDAFNQGSILSREDCVSFLSNSGFGERESYFAASTPCQIMSRMMRNLIFVYNRRREPEKVKWLSKFVDLVS